MFLTRSVHTYRADSNQISISVWCIYIYNVHRTHFKAYVRSASQEALRCGKLVLRRREAPEKPCGHHGRLWWENLCRFEWVPADNFAANSLISWVVMWHRNGHTIVQESLLELSQQRCPKVLIVFYRRRIMPSLLGPWGSIWSGVHWLMKLHSWWVWDWAFCIGLLRCSWHVPFYRNHLSVPRRRSCAAFSSASEVAKLWLWRWGCVWK